MPPSPVISPEESAYRSFGEQSLHYFIREHADLPTGPVESPAAWRGADMVARQSDWRHPVATEILRELDERLDSLEAQGTPIEDVHRDAHPLPRLFEAAKEWRADLASGRGFVVLTGLPVERWGETRSGLAFWLIGHALGVPGAQNASDELLGHVIDYGETSDAPHVRLYRTASNIGFHCDAADVVGLLCLEKAVSGGASRIASSVAIWNALFQQDPDAAKLLFEPFAVDRRDEQPPDQRPFFDMAPCRFDDEGTLRTFYHGEYFRSAQRLEEIGTLAPERIAALDQYDAIGNDPAYRLDMHLEPGDIQFISNHSIVHARTEYEDAADRKRHLLRLWLSLE